MADGGGSGWAQGTAAANGEERVRRTLAELGPVLSALEARLADSPPATDTAAVATLSQALDVLARRLEEAEAKSATRYARLADQLARLAQQVEVARAAPLPEVSAPASWARPPAKAPPDAPRVRAALLAASGAAVLSVAAAGVAVVSDGAPRAPAALVFAPPSPLARGSTGPRDAPARAASGPTRRPSGPTSTWIRTRPGAADPNPPSPAGGLPALLGRVQAGDAAAQLGLAALYESGASGLPHDLAAARDWTRRAAEGGDRIAMHNLALFLLNGEGGERDLPQAARWLKRAADLGVVDAEHNLGLLYEAGRGVEKNLAEAYRWQVIAANAGDLDSRERALALEPRLTPSERAAVQAKAAAFRPGAGGPAADGPLVAPAVTLAGAQALLARSGYYVGPTDGAPDPRYAAAAAAYLKDHPEARP